MDASRFDDLARAIGQRATRRGALRFLAGAGLGMGISTKGPFASARACRLIGERCGKQRGHCCGDASCRKGRSGVGVCVCPQNRTNCGGYCVDNRSNPNACGATCAQCPPETDCCNGVCCPEGQRCCGGICTDLTADNNNCGGCTQQCPAGLTCCDSRCRTFESDPRHCGKCGNVCGQNQFCRDSLCACRRGYRSCGDGFCRNIQSDPMNCGNCGVRCLDVEMCQDFFCVCRPGRQVCGGTGPTPCGLPDNAICTRGEDCCNNSCDFAGGVGHCYPCLGRQCDGTRPCCGGLPCVGQSGAFFCGGCRGQDEECTADTDCCFTDCSPEGNFRTCLSLAGGRCAAPSDCRACREDEGNCVNACVDGRCRV